MVLPQELLCELDPAERAGLIAHELAHLKRHDHWVRWFEVLVLGIYWWNPIAWWARTKIQQAEEECCDAWVLWAFPGTDRLYAQTLLQTVDFLAGVAARTPSVATAFNQGHSLKRRIEMIVDSKISRKLSRKSRALLALFVVAAAPLSLAGQSGERELNTDRENQTSVPSKASEPLGKAHGPENDEKQATTGEDLLMEFSKVEHLWQQEAIARKLITLGEAKIIPKLEKHLATENRRRRCNAAWVMAGLGEKRGLAVIISELEDKSPRPTDMIRSDGEPYPEGQITADRYYATVLLGRLGMKEAVPVLIKALEDETIHYVAAISLGEIGDKRAIPALRQMLTAFPDQRLWAGYGLAALGEPNGFKILTDVIDSDPKWTDRRHAVEALGKFKQPQTLPVIVKALQDSHVNVRVSAARALGAMQDPAALPALTAALTDKEVTKIHSPTTVETEARKAIKLIKEKGKRRAPR